MRRALEGATTIQKVKALDELMWRAYGAGLIVEAEATALSALFETRKQILTTHAQDAAEERATADRRRASQAAARRGSAPRSQESLERRRRWAASGRLSPALAARHTPGEIAALSVVAAEAQARGDCRLPIGQIAALAGVCETVVRNALREARAHGLLTVEERRLTATRSDTNIVRIVSAEWASWLRLKQSSTPRGSGCKFAKPTNTQRLIKNGQRPAAPAQRLPGGRAAAQAAPESRSAEGR
ncbi:hypothetical protein VQ02_11680 [Methylobacterium variabile]|uniref:Uncharacterized protein n=1 Tax=Methylobacterium variabile TaxID=298794 RepID=A0A0J6SXY7_9HYPH|nr:hypothetical protein VQ02_11680 [Methylobacterium variabile]